MKITAAARSFEKELGQPILPRDEAGEYASEEGRRTFSESNPMRRPGDVWDVAEACVYLAAPSGKFITGELLTIDGGQQMWGDFWSSGRPDYFKIA